MKAVRARRAPLPAHADTDTAAAAAAAAGGGGDDLTLAGLNVGGGL
jgi:hypothetical protein